MKLGQANIDFDGLIIDGPSGTHSVEAKVMDVLKVLVDRAGDVVLREDLIDHVWGVGYGGDERLSRAVSLLRKALGDTRGDYQYIQTVPKRGYKLIADVQSPLPRIVPPSLIEASETAPDTVSNSVDAAVSALIEDATQAETVTSEIKSSSENGRPRIVIIVLSFAMIAIAAFTGLRMIGGDDPVSDLPRLGETADVVGTLDDGLNHIINFTDEGAVENAQAIFSNLLAKDPENTAARAGLALSYIREYTHLESDPALITRASSAAEAALNANEHLALANIAAAWAAEFNQDFERSHKLLDQADILEPGNLMAFEGRIRTYYKAGSADDVRLTLDAAISAYPDHAHFYSLYGVYLMSQDNLPAAENRVREAISIKSNNPRFYAQLAHLLHHQEKTSEAIRVLQDGLNINDSAALYNNLGTLLYFQGQFDMAAAAFEKTVDFEGNSHNFLHWANLADSYRQIPGRKSDANNAYDRAIQLLKDDMKNAGERKTSVSRLALYQAKRGQFKRAKDTLSRIEFSDKDLPIVYYRALITYEIISDRQSALAMLDKCLEAGHPTTEILNEPELDDLRQDAQYHLIVAKYGE